MITATATRTRPIAFRDHEVRDTLEGRKTQFRRPARAIIDCFSPEFPINPIDEIRRDESGVTFVRQTKVDETSIVRFTCPYGRPGDRLWVRETWMPWHKCSHEYDEWEPVDRAFIEDRDLGDLEATRHDGLVDSIQYKADGKSAGPWRPSIHMPRWASRITLEITGVRVERLQEISEEDAEAEGFERTFEADGSEGWGAGLIHAQEHFARSWDAHNKKQHPWDSNPWVWIVSYSVVR